jgi:release factor glutamine methyltransferase
VGNALRAAVETSEAEAHWIMEAATGRPYREIAARRERVDEGVVGRAMRLATRRAAGEPLQYLLGSAYFGAIELAVGPGVFIPRPETELVAQRAMDRLRQGGLVVDVGTGSGAIALGVATQRSDATVMGTEISPDAMLWAEKNRDALGLPVRLALCDLLDGLPATLKGRLDVVVSNPPYVAQADRASLPPDVVDHEPHVALFAESRGLAVMERLAREARLWLRPGGCLVCEIGHGQGTAVASMLGGLGYATVSVSLDLAERERIAEGAWAGGPGIGLDTADRWSDDEVQPGNPPEDRVQESSKTGGGERPNTAAATA